MKDDRDPTVNLKNINFINVAERYKRKVRSGTILFKASVPKLVENDGKVGNSQEEAAKEYYKTHMYMMHERMCELITKNANMTVKDKKIIEDSFNIEYKELNKSLKEIKQAINDLYAENNGLYNNIEKITEEMKAFVTLIIERKK